MLVKIHNIPGNRILLAVCDKNLIGKSFQEKNFELNLKTDFYLGTEKTQQETISLMEKANIINLVGEKSVKLGIAAKIVDKNNVKKICGIPHAQAFVIS